MSAAGSSRERIVASSEANSAVIVPERYQSLPATTTATTRTEYSVGQALRELRAEWKEPRDRVWRLIDALRESSDAFEMRRIRDELGQASRVLSPAREAVLIEPSQVLWDLVTDATVVAAAIATGDRAAKAAAVVGTISHVLNNAVTPATSYIFRRGALDSARRVRSEVIMAPRIPDLLDRFLSDEERKALST
jgi:hypothetical protein